MMIFYAYLLYNNAYKTTESYTIIPRVAWFQKTIDGTNMEDKSSSIKSKPPSTGYYHSENLMGLWGSNINKSPP